MAKNIEWWRGTATHMWRTYFALRRDGFAWDKLSLPKQKTYAVCNHLFTKEFTKMDQEILKHYFSTKWGDDIFAVEDYAANTHTPKHVIWIVIRRANRRVMEEVGLLEKKDGDIGE